MATLVNVQAALRNEVIRVDDPEAFKVVSSKEYGACAALLQLAKDINLPAAIYSRPHEQWVQDVLAMIVGRLVWQGSKLFLSHAWSYSALWELCGINGAVDVDTHCYAVLDRLLERQPAIQKNLAKRHLSNGCLILYDITSSYLEGEYAQSELVQFGHNRDGKRGHEQIVIGLLTDPHGCPVAVEVFPGNTQDATTVEAKVKEIHTQYGVKELVLVGDRGMITKSNEAKLALLPEAEGLKIISALTHRQIVNLLEKNGLQPDLFDDNNIIEITDPDQPDHRYCLCRNPHTAARARATRSALIERTRRELQRIAVRKTRASTERLSAQAGCLLAKTKMGKFVTWKVEEGRLQWSVSEEDVAAEAALDGCYVIKTTVSAEALSKENVVARYKSLARVEQAFRNLKTVAIEVRPICHKTDDRIRAHVFLCMLAYYLLWHFMQRLEPLFAEQEAHIDAQGGQAKNRRWTLQSVLETLKAQRRNLINCRGAQFTADMPPNADQSRLLSLLQIPPTPVT